MTATPSTPTNNDSTTTKKKSIPSLSNLLAALALGARSVNSLPLSTTTTSNKDDKDDNDDNNNDNDEDEFGYHMAFPEFNSLCTESRSKLSSILQYTLQSSVRELVVDGEDDELEFEFDDPMLWESATEACDLLLERVDVYILNVKEGRQLLGVGGGTGVVDVVERAGVLAKRKASRSMDCLLGSLVEMEKPQITYNFTSTIQNSRQTPFLPPHQQHQTLQPGHGIDTRHYDGTTFPRPLPTNIIAPTEHYAHPYAKEIQALTYGKQQLEVMIPPGGSGEDGLGLHGRGGTLHNPKLANECGVWIDTEAGLKLLVNRIEGMLANDDDESQGFCEMAVDLEAHNYRSFSGFVCLMQISIRRPNTTTMAPPPSTDTAQQQLATTIANSYDFLIDTLALRTHIHHHLSPLFLNPSILKIMHGADSDVPWLQRDFGIYIRNLFDTGRGARVLRREYAGYGLAHLLQRHAGVVADKRHQLSDWRERPLGGEMKGYAVGDTMYLLDVYDKVRLDLIKYGDAGNEDVSIKGVLEASCKVSLIRHAIEPFRPEGYRRLLSRRRRKKNKNNSTNISITEQREEALLKKLFEWRDSVARLKDESIQYVCPDSGLTRIAASFPHSVYALRALINPLPVLVLEYVEEIIGLVNGIVYSGGGGVSGEPGMGTAVVSSPEKMVRVMPTSSITPEPSSSVITTTTTTTPQRNGMMSPVLGTEALYKQAGWMSGTISSDDDGGVTSSSTEGDDNDNDGGGGGNTVEVNPANRNFVASEYTSHSLEMGSIEQQEEVGDDNDTNGCNTTTNTNTVNNNKRGKTVNGLGAAKSIMDNNNIDEVITSSGTEAKRTTTMTIELEEEEARHCADRIRETMLNENLLGIVHSSRNYEGNGGSVTGEDKEGEVVEEDGDDVMITDESIPKSMADIYRISHRNRRKTKKTAVVFPPTSGDPAQSSSEDMHNLEEAEALLARSGPGGTGYFPTSTAMNNKRQRTTTKQTQQDSMNIEEEDDNTALVVELGWANSKAEVEALRQQSLPEETQSNKNNNSNKIAQQQQNSTTGGVLTKREMKQARNDRRTGGGGQTASARMSSEPVLPAAYSHVGNIGIYDRNAPTPNNPFFTGAAVGAGTLNRANAEKAARQKKQSVSLSSSSSTPNNKKGKRGGNGGDNRQAGGKRDSNKSHVYRN